MKKLISFILAAGMMAQGAVFAAEKNVLDFTANIHAAEAVSNPEVSVRHDQAHGCLVVNPNYVEKAGVIVRPDFTFGSDVYVKIRYYLTGTVNEQACATILDGIKEHVLFDYQGKTDGKWYEDVVHIPDFAHPSEFTLVPVTSTAGWTTGADIYIDYLGFFSSEEEAKAFSEPDDDPNAKITKTVTYTPTGDKISVKATKYVSGYNNQYFLPDAGVKRSEAAAMISRIVSADVSEEPLEIPDVLENAWYYEDVKKLAENGIIAGSGAFLPDQILTRRELSEMLYRMGILDTEKTMRFSDVDISDPDYAAITACGGNGLMIGDNGAFLPDSEVTRAQIVAVLNRVIGTDLSQAEEIKNPYSDLSPTHWAYRDIMAVSKGDAQEPGADGEVVFERFPDGVEYDVNNTRNKVWEEVPFVTKEMKEQGYEGGEGGQAILYVTTDTTGDIVMSFSDAGQNFRSLDGGETWERCARDVNANSLSTGEIDPNNSKRVVAYTHSGSPRVENDTFNYCGTGVYLSEDTGYSYQNTLPYCELEAGWRVAFAWDPTSYDAKLDGSKICYFTTCQRKVLDDNYGTALKWQMEKGYNEGPGFYRSEDGGYSWKLVNADLGACPPAVSPADGTVFAASPEGLYRSTDHGNTWEVVISGKVGSVTTLLNEPDNVYATDDNGLLISTDRGKTFERITSASYPGEYVNNLKVSPANSDYMMISYNHPDVNKIGSFVSHDRGTSWTRTEYDESLDFYKHQFRWKITAWHPTDENKAWTTSDWVESSEDGGRTFHWNHNGNCGTCINSPFWLNVYNPDYYLVPAQDFQGALTLDGGYSFTALDSFPANPGKSHNYGGYVVDENTFFFCNTNSWEAAVSNLIITHDGGKSFTNIGEVSSGARNNYCFQSQVNPNIYFAGNLRSEDAGYNWQALPDYIMCVAAYNPNGNELFAIGANYGAVYVSKDTGVTWEKLFDRPIIYDNEAYSGINNLAYDGINNILYFTQADTVAKYENGKITRLNCEQMKDKWRTTLAVDPIHPNVIYTGGVPNGVEGFTTYDLIHSIYRSLDGGETWQVISSADTDQSIVPDGPLVGNYFTWAMFVHPKTGYVYAGLPNYGLYKFAPPYEIEE